MSANPSRGMTENQSASPPESPPNEGEQLLGTTDGRNPNYDPNKAIAFWQNCLMEREQELAEARAELASLKTEQLTPGEATTVLVCCRSFEERLDEGHPFAAAIFEKLQRISASPHPSRGIR